MDLGVADRVFVITGGSRGLGRATAEVLVAEGRQGRPRRTRPAAAQRDGRLARTGPLFRSSDRPCRVGCRTATDGGGGRTVRPDRRRSALLRGPATRIGAGNRRRRLARRLRVGVSRAASHRTGPGLDHGRRRRAGLRPEQFGPRADTWAGDLQRPSTGAGRRRQGPGRRAGTSSHPGQRVAARSDQHRSHPRARRQGWPWRLSTTSTRGARSRLGRYGDPIEFGTVAAFALSAAASYLTGALIPVDGGARRAR